MTKRISIIDGDLLVYKCAAAAEERSIVVTHQPTGITKSFKTRTEFKKIMKSKNKEITEDYKIEDHQEPESPAFCFKVIRQKIEKIKRLTNSDEVEIWCTDVDNFRLDLPLPTRYKSTRKDQIRPILLKEAQDYVKRSFNAKQAKGFEVDDMIIIRSYEELEKGNYPILPIWEKDTTQATNLNIWIEEDNQIKTLPELGELIFNKPNTVKGSGLKFLCFQWLFGDTTDNYCGYDLVDARFGAKSAYDLLIDLTTVKECLEIVIQKYKEWYPEPFEYTSWDEKIIKADWKFMLDLYFKCCWMKRRIDDPSDPKELFDKYGVMYE